MNTPVKSKCEHCGGYMQPIGNARKNGKSHNDWGSRKYHKKCWKEMNDARIFMPVKDEPIPISNDEMGYLDESFDAEI